MRTKQDLSQGSTSARSPATAPSIGRHRGDLGRLISSILSRPGGVPDRFRSAGLPRLYLVPHDWSVGAVLHRHRVSHLPAGVVGVVALLAMCGAFLPVPPSRPAPSGDLGLISDSSAGNFTLAADGSSPGAVGLSWTSSVTGQFVDFEVYVSNVSSNGPWTKLATFFNPYAHQYFAHGLTPATPYWWTVSVDDRVLGTSLSNVVFVPTSSAPASSVEQTSPRTVTLSWTDSANYSNAIGFVSYEVLRDHGGGPPMPLATLTDPASRSYTLTSVANNTTLSLQVVATARCLVGSNCGPHPPTVLAPSNVASLTTASSLGLRVEARSISTLPPSTMRFTANETGGVAPFAYVWTFGDGANATGASVLHRYAENGSYNATCSVTDAFGSKFNATVNVRLETSVVPNGSSGNVPPGAAPPPSPVSSPTAPQSGSALPSDGLNNPSINHPALAILIIAMVAYAVASRRWPGKPPAPPPEGAAAAEPARPPGRE
jgi:PKD domain